MLKVLKEGGINYPFATLTIFVLFMICAVILFLIVTERSKSISAKEMRAMDPIINYLTIGLIVLFSLLLYVLLK